MDKLPVFEMVIEDNTESDIGVSFVALVSAPAIEKNFMAFKSMKVDFMADTERKIISGPAMIADSLIYRKDDNGEYNVFFSKKTVEDIALKFFKMDYQKNLNLFHDPKLSLEGVTIFESFVTDASRGIMPMKGYEDLPDGTWFISCKVENDDVWEKIKAGEVKGFSVEGIFSYVKKQQPKNILEEISELLNRTYNTDGLFSKNEFMSKVVSPVKDMISKFKKAFFSEEVITVNASGETEVKTDYALKDGTLCKIDKLEAGGVMLIGEAPAGPGEYELTDGTKVTVGEAGLISAITPVVDTQQQQAPPPTPQPPVTTPQQQMQAMKEAVEKFAAGTPEERLANLEVIAKAVMEYCFGWELRKAEEEAQRNAAIAVYRTGLETHKTELAAQFSSYKTEMDKKLTDANTIISKQQETIKGLFEIVEKLGEFPTEEDPTEPKLSFSSEKAANKAAKLKLITESISNLKKNKTA